MKFGIATFITDEGVKPDVLGRALEERGFSSLFMDLDEVLGGERVPAAEVPARLRELAPDYPPYRGLTGVMLREILAREYGFKVPSTGNRFPIDPRTIRVKLAGRDEGDDHGG